MKLYTKTGDDGTTALFGGHRVAKNDVRVDAYGHVDEASAAIGVALSGCGDEEAASQLREIQSDLFVVGAVLASPVQNKHGQSVDDEAILRLETWIDEASSETKPLKTFVLPGGCATGAALHLARTICRRAERAACQVATESELQPNVVIYLNRLSDLLFAMARRANQRAGAPETPWLPTTSSP